MPDYIVSLSDNILRAALFQNVEPFLTTASKNLDTDIADDTKVISPDAFSGELISLLAEIAPSKPKNIPVYFLVEPQDISAFFVTISKNGGEEEDQVIKEINSKLKEDGKNLEDMYFSYQKIAPFVFQFVGMDKGFMEMYMQIQTSSGIDLRGVMPWSLLLPKSVANGGRPEIFIVDRGDSKVITLSELGGVYYTGLYDDNKTPEELGKLVNDLSFYNRNTPISRIFTVNYDEFKGDKSVTVEKIPAGIDGLEIEEGQELHILAQQVFDKDEDLLESQINLLNTLPTPAEAKRNPLVYAGIAAAVLIVIGVAFGAYYYISRNGISNNTQTPVADVTADDAAVLSENNEVEESTPSEVQETTPNEELDKSEIKIRVENGAGIEGIAGRTQEFLEALGYTVVSIGNADEVGRENTLIRLSSDTAQYKQILEEDIGEKYDIEVVEDLESGLDYDVLVIVGTS